MMLTLLDDYAKIPQPALEDMGFVADLKAPMKDYFSPELGCEAGENKQCLERGYHLVSEFQQPEWQVETALASLKRVLQDKGITAQDNGYPIRLIKTEDFEEEEFEVNSGPQEACLRFGDSEGLRRAVYWYEDKLRECAGAAATPGQWRRKPYVKHRISRCFFGPTYRAPFFIDELTNDVDYYPETYLDKLAHEGINGLWLSMYFHDLPSSLFPGRGKDAPKRLAKLKQTVEKCGRFGIKVYLYVCEPKIWGISDFAIPLSEASGHPQVVGGATGAKHEFHCFCTSSEEGQTYLRESVTQIFSAVPELGGMINIMYGEDSGSCGSHMLTSSLSSCPLCSSLGAVKVLQNMAKLMSDAMKKVSPHAEYIGWFYAPSQRDGTHESDLLAAVADGWPEDCGLMFNFESGGQVCQLGKERTVFDYSLAFVGPSQLFERIATRVPKTAAKLQVGCSHEDASVPFIPVPLHLYDKYSTLHRHQVYAVMQCWYFGNYPGLMNQAAGKLSFEPFAESGDAFLEELARPDWKNYAPVVIKAWKLFSQSYRQFPGNIAFEWYGPLHNSVAWPWYLFPVDKPISPTWLLENFPEVSGDRAGESIGYHHTLKEALQLLTSMCQDWQAGMALLTPLKKTFSHDPNRLADISLAEAVGLQMHSTRNMLEFYDLREDMLYFRHNHLERMAELVRDEIRTTERMNELCLQDPRLGYHSEAEGYLFFPKKLQARKQLLQKLLDEDFPKFDLQASWLDAYVGTVMTGPVAHCGKHADECPETYACGESGVRWTVSADSQELHVSIMGSKGKRVLVEIEPCRNWPPVTFSVTPDLSLAWDHFHFRKLYDVHSECTGEGVTVSIPWEVFDGYRKPGFPMRINVTADGKGWVERKPWPTRLYQADFNPESMGWLALDD